MRAALEAALADGIRRIAGAHDVASLEEARVRVLGRKAPLSRARASLRDVTPDARKELGRLANDVSAELETALGRRVEALAAAERRERWQRERIDVTLPGDAPPVGGIHPLTRTIWRIVDIFAGLGYRVAEGPEVELSSYTFDALRIPVQHPSRAPQDTFYVAGAGEDVCLRPHTSPVQIRAMERTQPPLYVVVPGRCYRRDEQDATHLAGFTQIEALAVDEGITMADLKGTLAAFARELFGRDLDVRLRPSFFPFTEPSAEMDVQCFVCRGAGCGVCKGEGWIEVLGCGMVHPHLFEWVGYDPERYSGFALGLGVERVASLAHGVADIRAFWDDDVRFLERFGGVA
ncbi:MAG TPA: phenylalanine--tRNA ligase subunit alpha [Actinomycetota bacterium]|nr:phenylalanine--tRNA ligase subunit alpha [Actinomycetota bacterium]